MQTTYSAFKYMIIYPLFQLLQTMILHYSDAIVGDFQYLFVDLVLVLPLGTLRKHILLPFCRSNPFLAQKVTWTHPALELSVQRTPDSLFSLRILISLAIQIFITIGSLVAAVIVLDSQSWYIPIMDTTSEHISDNVTRFAF